MLQVKALHGEIAAAEHEAQQLEAQHQHLKRQQAALAERIARLEAQCRTKHDAAESSIEEQLRDKEAIEAENAAAAARLQENEAMVGGGAWENGWLAGALSRGQCAEHAEDLARCIARMEALIKEECATQSDEWKQWRE